VSRSKTGTMLVAVAACLGMLMGSALGNVTLTQGNSIVELNFGDEPVEVLGMYAWEVDGTNHLYEQWFWYRVGDSGGEEPLHPLDMVGIPLTDDLDGDGDDDAVDVAYSVAGLNISLRFVLVGGAPGSETSTVVETIVVTNATPDTLDVHFFQYADFDLWDDAEFDSVEILGDPKNTAVQWEAPLYVAETVVTGAGDAPTHYEAGTWDDLPSIWERLEDDDPTVLKDVAGPIEDTDAVWAFQWDKTLGPGDSLVISKDKIIMPEPATLALMGAGMAITLAARRRRRR